MPAGTDVQIDQVIGSIEEQTAGASAESAPAPKTESESAPASTPAPAPAAPAADAPPAQVFDIIVPSAGESISEGTIAEWLKNDGDRINKGEDIVVIDTEKASTDLQAEHSGILRITVPAGTDVRIEQVIGKIEVGAGEQEKALHVAAPTPQPGTAQPEIPAAAAAKAPEPQKPAAPAPAPKPAPKPAPVVRDGDQPITIEPMSRMRRTIAAHLLKARQETAMLTTFAEVDMSAIMALRKKHQDAFVKKHGVKLGFMSFFIKACCDALQKFPAVNASIEGNDVVYHHYVNMGVAVSTDRGLSVPVIRDAQNLGFADIESGLIDLANQARTGRIPLDLLKGGTFTITNGGVFGSMMSTPIINPPQVGILGMHSIVERPVAINGKVEIRPMMYLALSYDHRIIDGKEAVQFLVHVRDHIASPERLLLGL